METIDILNLINIDSDIFITLDDLNIKYNKFNVSLNENDGLILCIFIEVDKKHIPTELMVAISDIMRIIENVRGDKVAMSSNRGTLTLMINISEAEMKLVPSEKRQLGFKIFKYI